MGVVLGYIVCADATEASKIGEVLVKEKLAACANVVPAVQSTFFWQGTFEKTEEALLFCKTVSEKIPAVEGCVKSLHSHDVPCICFYQAAHVNAEYDDWVRKALAD